MGLYHNSSLKERKENMDIQVLWSLAVLALVGIAVGIWRWWRPRHTVPPAPPEPPERLPGETNLQAVLRRQAGGGEEGRPAPTPAQRRAQAIAEAAEIDDDERAAVALGMSQQRLSAGQSLLDAGINNLVAEYYKTAATRFGVLVALAKVKRAREAESAFARLEREMATATDQAADTAPQPAPATAPGPATSVEEASARLARIAEETRRRIGGA
ncbi:MAG: hypothetical protein A3E08_00665 [Candidatus Wildermuthbacteria bacterium RIFCSPHIGHO2_12_FULL_49_13]|nr:MAG: hypothetical protein A3E08_00665 [Candidatus Wildermuthbacteria bacterium RIFCSPHIGHO2_12_FULL_49_13]OHA78016.1 MAG: hypothetical protein A2564_00015 [Candidatus Wildermuthbacteria bacterium RIFOXYD1_FULL_50_12]